VCQRSNDSEAQRSTPTVACSMNSARTVRAESEQRQKAHRTVNSACPVRPRTSGAPRCQSSNGRNHQNPNGWVMWLAHRTVRCAHRQQPSPTAVLVVGAINTPNHQYSRHPNFQHIAFNTRALDFTPRHKQEIKSSSKSKTTPNT
jgi:hypothetical protein